MLLLLNARHGRMVESTCSRGGDAESQQYGSAELADSHTVAPRAAKYCGGAGAGAASDRAAGATDCADHGTEEGAPPQTIHRRPPRRTPKTNRYRSRAGELGS